MSVLRFARLGSLALLVTALGGLVLGSSPAAATPAHQLFVLSARENADYSQTTLPLMQGTSQGRPVWYVVLDSSDRADATQRGVNYAPKLANARGTAAVQTVQLHNGVVDFPASVDFSPQRVALPGPTGFPPAQVAPGAVGETGYSPLIALPDGTVLNAPQIANATGQADKVIMLDPAQNQVVYRETEGRYANSRVHYLSFDASVPPGAAIEDVTLAPALAAAPTLGDESPASAREGLLAFINGQTGATNPQRQGLNSALLDGLPPLNMLHAVPYATNDSRFPLYSPIWDARFAAWTPAAIAAGQNTRQGDFNAVLQLVQQGQVTGPGGAAFGPVGVVVNCPVISLDAAEAPVPGMPTTGAGAEPAALGWWALLSILCLAGGWALTRATARQHR